MIRELLKGFEFATKLADYREGQPVLLQCFSISCPSCSESTCRMAEFCKKFPGVYVVGASADEDLEGVARMVARVPKMSEFNVAADQKQALNSFLELHHTIPKPCAFLFDS